jgi:hypothetical protein
VDKVLLAIKAVKKGEELTNANAWGNTAMLSGFLAILIKVAASFYPALSVYDYAFDEIADGIACVAIFFSTYCNAALSKKVGL